MVAKSFQSLEQTCEPFTTNGKQYVKVRCKNGNERTVRWYTTTEYYKLYPDEKKDGVFDKPRFRSQKDVLGFEKGYITLIKGNTTVHRQWLLAAKMRHTRWWGWFCPSENEMPDDLPSGLSAVRLPWEEVGDENGNLNPEPLVITAVAPYLYTLSSSEYIGSVGDRLELTLKVEKAIDLDSKFGHTTMHIMRDECENCFVWTTAAKHWATGSEHHLRGTIKAQKEYQGEKQNILTRCTEISLDKS